MELIFDGHALDVSAASGRTSTQFPLVLFLALRNAVRAI
jgi:hypothetical protein